jgi:hypothetical protein
MLANTIPSTIFVLNPLPVRLHFSPQQRWLVTVTAELNEPSSSGQHVTVPLEVEDPLIKNNWIRDTADSACFQVPATGECSLNVRVLQAPPPSFVVLVFTVYDQGVAVSPLWSMSSTVPTFSPCTFLHTTSRAALSTRVEAQVIRSTPFLVARHRLRVNDHFDGNYPVVPSVVVKAKPQSQPQASAAGLKCFYKDMGGQDKAIKFAVSLVDEHDAPTTAACQLAVSLFYDLVPPVPAPVGLLSYHFELDDDSNTGTDNNNKNSFLQSNTVVIYIRINQVSKNHQNRRFLVEFHTVPAPMPMTVNSLIAVLPAFSDPIEVRSKINMKNKCNQQIEIAMPVAAAVEGEPLTKKIRVFSETSE